MDDRRWRRRQDRRRRDLRHDFQGLARRLGLKVEARDGKRIFLRGKMSRCSVQVARAPAAGESLEWMASVTSPGIPAALSIGSETGLSRLKKLVSGEGVLTYDAEFDAEILVSGPVLETIAVLDVGTRRRLRDLVSHRWVLSDGAIVFGYGTKDEDEVPPDFVRQLRSAAHTVSQMSLRRKGVGDRLVHNVRHDLLPVGLRNLELLLEHEPELRLRLDVDTLLDTLDQAFAQTPSPLEQASRTRALRALSALSRDRRGLLGEGALIALLSHSTSEGERLELIEALAERGGDRAVEALLPHTSGLFVDRATKEAAREAVVRVQKRTGEVRGQLSLDEGSEGRLTIGGEAGGLSVEGD
jgi:hypothetical protein